MLAEIAAEEYAAALDAAARAVLDEAGIDRPPVDALKLARLLGIAVALDDRQRGRARFVRLKGYRGSRPRETIVLRPEARAERRQWAIAHEIGEQAAWRVFAVLGVDPAEAAPTARESVANQLAGRLLLPGAWFAADAAECGWDLLELKRRYRTASHELIARRMLELPPPVIITIYDHQQVFLRRSNVPGCVPSPTAAELQCWRAVHRGNHPRKTFDGLRSVQGWPVHEDGWKREILRSEVEQQFD